MKMHLLTVSKMFAFTLALAGLLAGTGWAGEGTPPITKTYLDKLDRSNYKAGTSNFRTPPTGMGIKSFKRIRREEKGKYNIDICYPVTGNPAIDAAIKAPVQRELKEFQEYLAEAKHSGYPAQDWLVKKTYFLTRPGKNAVSIVAGKGWYAGGLFDTYYDMSTFDLRTGKKLTFADMFRNEKKAVQILREQSRAALRRNGQADDYTPFDNYKHGDDAQVFLNSQGLQTILPCPAGVKLLVTVPIRVLAPAGPNPDIWPAARGDERRILPR